jgi:hypothetical protein
VISWKHSFKRLNEEYEIAKKKKQALDNLYTSGRISQSTRDSFNNDISAAIVEIERQQKDLLEKMQNKTEELAGQIKTLETLLANYEIQHVVGEIEEDTYQREIILLSTGLDTAKNELDVIKMATMQLCAPVQTVQAPVAPAVPAAPAPVIVESVTVAAPEPVIIETAPAALVIEAAPVEQAPIEVAPVIEVPIEVAPVIEAAPIETPVEAAPIETAPIEAAIAPVEEAAPVIETPVFEAAPIEEPVMESAPVVEEAAPIAPAEPEVPAAETAIEIAPAELVIAVAEPAVEEPVMEAAPVVEEAAPVIEAPIENIAPIEEAVVETPVVEAAQEQPVEDVPLQVFEVTEQAPIEQTLEKVMEQLSSPAIETITVEELTHDSHPSTAPHQAPSEIITEAANNDQTEESDENTTE